VKTPALWHEPFNAVIVGNGAIGSALAQRLSQEAHLQELIILQRSSAATPRDSRVKYIAFDALQPESVAAAAEIANQSVDRVHLMVNTVGMLHSPGQRPEKSLRKLVPADLQRAFQINATLLPLLAQAFSALLRHEQPAVFASLSARVGSIEDNRLGGWYSYRASKAAHNMLLRTIAQEWRVTHPNVTAVALHPGTVQSPLSSPFISSNYKHPVRAPSECAESLLRVLRSLPPHSSGTFYDWQGKTIPW
jgi:NAD(P)-dependent dehydrogenase (short-subunit alcohol dehydrogenase family)